MTSSELTPSLAIHFGCGGEIMLNVISSVVLFQAVPNILHLSSGRARSPKASKDSLWLETYL